MDNQATKHIKQFLSETDCKLQHVEPHNHRVNVAEHAIQTFKDAFIATLATTDVDFPLQLWDTLAPQVQTCLNLMRCSSIDPSISAHKTLYGPYDWNRYPLTPLGCKAVVYEDGNTRGSWTSCGVDRWYLGPSMDHYRCDLYFIPETRAFRISGSTELFPQHCQLPNLTPHQHFRALTEELANATAIASAKPKGRRLIKLLQENIKKILNPTSALEEQRVRDNDIRMQQQRVIDSTPIITVPMVPHITNKTTNFAIKKSYCKTYPQRHSVRALMSNTKQHTGRRTKDKQTPYPRPCNPCVPSETSCDYTDSRSQGSSAEQYEPAHFCSTSNDCSNHPQIGYSGHNVHANGTCPICKNHAGNMLRTLREPYGPSNHGRDNIQL